MRFATNKTWYYGTADLFVAKPKGGFYLHYGGSREYVGGDLGIFGLRAFCTTDTFFDFGDFSMYFFITETEYL